jgi:hypothetical protein
MEILRIGGAVNLPSYGSFPSLLLHLADEL